MAATKLSCEIPVQCLNHMTVFYGGFVEVDNSKMWIDKLCVMCILGEGERGQWACSPRKF